MRSPFLRKLFLWMAVLVLAVAGLLVAGGILVLDHRHAAAQELRLESLAEVGARLLEQRASSFRDVGTELGEVGRLLGVDVEVLGPDGRSVARSLEAPGPDGPRLTASRPLRIAGENGRLRVIGFASPAAGRGPLLLAGLAVALAGAAGAFLLARWLTAPVRSLAQAAESLTVGVAGSRGEERGRDEVAALAGAFQRARDRLAAQLETITRDRNQLTAVLASMAEGVVAVDENERILHVNRVAVDLLGVDREPRSFDDRPVLELTRDPHILHAVTETLENGTAYRGTCKRGEGADERVLELTSSVLRRRADASDDDGITGAVLVLHDVTRLQRLEGLRRDFVSNVSHELKTPLTAIRGFVETMLEAEDLDAATRHRFLTRIRQQSNRLAELVSDLLSLSRIESAEGERPMEPVDARVAVVETLQALRPAIDGQGVTVHLDLAAEPVLVRAEAESLRQAFSNLIDNAVKYSDAGAEVHVRLAAEEGCLLFDVQDEGPGIEGAHLERIFERFYRVDKARSRQVGGTGLGLAIVKNVASALGGSVQVESEKGRGSRFRMVLPMAEGTPQEEGGDPSSPDLHNHV